MKYTIVIEKTPNNYAAYAPDLPGCVAAADTRDEVVKLMREAIEFHLEGLRRDGDPVPPPLSTATQVDVAAWTESSSITARAASERRVVPVSPEPPAQIRPGP